jgi:hypothetical protein
MTDRCWFNDDERVTLIQATAMEFFEAIAAPDRHWGANEWIRGVW